MKPFANGLAPHPSLQGKRIMPKHVRRIRSNEEALEKARRKSFEDVGCISRHFDNRLSDYIMYALKEEQLPTLKEES